LPLEDQARGGINHSHLAIALSSLVLPGIIFVYLVFVDADLGIVLRDELYLASTIIGFIISFLSFYTYSLTGSRRVLWLSAGFFMISLGLLLSSLSDLDFLELRDIDASTNTASWFRNAGALSGWLFILLGAARKNRTITEGLRFRAAIAVISITIVSAVVLFAVVSSSYLPPLYIEGSGWTDLSLGIGLAIFGFKLVVAAIYASIYLKSKNTILFYFVIGFVLSSYVDLLFSFGRIFDLPSNNDILLEARFLIPLSFASFLIGLLKTR
jgi:hypothetical protein